MLYSFDSKCAIIGETRHWFWLPFILCGNCYLQHLLVKFYAYLFCKFTSKSLEIKLLMLRSEYSDALLPNGREGIMTYQKRAAPFLFQFLHPGNFSSLPVWIAVKFCTRRFAYYYNTAPFITLLITIYFVYILSLALLVCKYFLYSIF
jgi:hypothetical protein